MRQFAALNESLVVSDMYRSDEAMSPDHIDVTEVFPPVCRGCAYDGTSFDDSGLSDDIKKHRGFPFQGVMCSATAEDQNGVTAVLTAYQLDKSAFTETRFDFSNGSRLLITKDNIEQFASEWIRFRQAFFNNTQE